MPKSQRVLRQRLQNIITEEVVRLHETKIVQLASKFDVAFIEPVHRQSEKRLVFNCFMHVLNLIDRVQPNVVKQTRTH